MERNDLIRDMTLMLIYLTSWKEKVYGEEICRAWKSYDWDALGVLDEQGLVNTNNRAKSVYLTEEGEKEASMLVEVYSTALDRMREDFAAFVQMTMPASHEPAFRFRVELDLGPKRECWREIVIPSGWAFVDLHEAIQASFLWWDYHQYDFTLRSHGEQCRIVDPEQGGVDAMFAPPSNGQKILDVCEILLDEVFPRTRTATYSYDYGDGWTCRVKLVEAIERYEGEMPVCTDGAGDAPPEDVGGPGGFERFLAAIGNEDDPEHAEMKEWGASQLFAPFSVEAANERIRRWRTGEILDDWDKAHPADEPDEA